MLTEEQLSQVLPASMRKDVVFTRHEVPISAGSSVSVLQSYYSPRVFRWAVGRWLEELPIGASMEAVRRTLPRVLSDADTFHGYLAVPDAFRETYDEELRELEKHRNDLTDLKNALPRRGWPSRRIVAIASASLLGLALNLIAWMR